MPPTSSQNLSTQSHATRRMPKLAWIIIGCILVLCLVSGAVIWLVAHKSKPDTHAGATQAQSQSVTTTPLSTTTQQYVSNGSDLNLSFTYPSGWSATPTSGNNTTDQPITLTSPVTSITKDDGSSATGKVILTIRPGTAQVSELDPGTATVAQDSTQFAYSKPTPSQHQYPYLTFIHLAGGQNPTNTFDEVIITGISIFTKGTTLNADSLGQLDPIISARFYACTTTACDSSSATALSVTSTMWQNSTLLQQIQSVFASLQLN